MAIKTFVENGFVLGCLLCLAFGIYGMASSREEENSVLKEEISILKKEKLALKEILKEIEGKNDNQLYASYVRLSKAHINLYYDWIRMKDLYEDGVKYGGKDNEQAEK